jgi:hypothetical protein
MEGVHFTYPDLLPNLVAHQVALLDPVYRPICLHFQTNIILLNNINSSSTSANSIPITANTKGTPASSVPRMTLLILPSRMRAIFHVSHSRERISTKAHFRQTVIRTASFNRMTTHRHCRESPLASNKVILTQGHCVCQRIRSRTHIQSTKENRSSRSTTNITIDTRTDSQMAPFRLLDLRTPRQYHLNPWVRQRTFRTR